MAARKFLDASGAAGLIHNLELDTMEGTRAEYTARNLELLMDELLDAVEIVRKELHEQREVELTEKEGPPHERMRKIIMAAHSPACSPACPSPAPLPPATRTG